MKSITVTTHRAINYGAVLQSYALNKTQLQLGIDNKLLDYNKKKNIYEPVSTKTMKRSLIALLTNCAYILKRNTTKRGMSRFNEYVDRYISLTRYYDSHSEIEKEPPEADFYINGSDQVFGLRGEFDRERMLQFGPKSIPRYSFAASLGEYDWNEEEKKTFAEILRGYSMISVREKYAKEYIEGFAPDIHCEVHMDPVFLLSKDEWKKNAAPRQIKDEYILCYPLIGNDDTQKVLDELRKKTGLKTVCVQIFPIKRVKADEYVFDAGPAEFLSLFMNASYVVTTSFHGTAFSLIFEKPFYTMIKNYKSQRMTDLLEMVGLSERIYSSDTIISASAPDFTACRDIISVERERGFDYLRRIIRDVQTKGESK